MIGSYFIYWKVDENTECLSSYFVVFFHEWKKYNLQLLESKSEYR